MKAVAAIIVLVLVGLAIASQAQLKQASAWECDTAPIATSGYQWLPVDIGNQQGLVADQVSTVSDGEGGKILLGRFPVPGANRVTGTRAACTYQTLLLPNGQKTSDWNNDGTRITHPMPPLLLTAELTFCGDHQLEWPRPCVRNGMIIAGVIAALVVGSFVGLALMFSNSLPPDDYDGYGAI